jgi:hypothetical protein
LLVKFYFRGAHHQRYIVLQTTNGHYRARVETVSNTPKALANSSPGLERSDNPGKRDNNNREPCKGYPPHVPNPYRV